MNNARSEAISHFTSQINGEKAAEKPEADFSNSSGNFDTEKEDEDQELDVDILLALRDSSSHLLPENYNLNLTRIKIIIS